MANKNVNSFLTTGFIDLNTSNSLLGVVNGELKRLNAGSISMLNLTARTGTFSNGSIAAVPLLNNPLTIVGSGNSYMQLNIQNRATGTFATADLVITANNGTDSTNFINLGINNSGYNDPAFSNGTGLDGYLFINGGNLDIGTQTPGTNVEFHVGGTTSNNSILRVTSSGIDLNTGCNIYGVNSYQRITGDFTTSALPSTRLSFNLEGGKVYEVDQYFKFTTSLNNSYSSTSASPVSSIPSDGYRFGFNNTTAGLPPLIPLSGSIFGGVNGLTTFLMGDLTGVANHIRKGILRPSQNATINFQAGSFNGSATTLEAGSYVIVKKLT
jgi:hypothetical protein